MKKVLLIIAAALTFGLGAIAQTVTMPWNQYGSGSPIIDYQGKDASKVSTYTPAVGDVVTVTIAGTSNQDIASFQVALVDDAAPSYWTELAGFKALGPVTSGTPFSFSVDLTVTQTGVPKIVFDGKNATLAGADGTGTSITLTLTTYTVSVFTPIAGAKILTDNADGTKQGVFTDILAITPAVKVGDIVRVTLEGTTDASATSFQTVLVDGTAAASYWTELSAWTAFTPAIITSGQNFTLTADIEITANPVGSGAGSQNIILSAVSTANLIQLSLTTFTAEIIQAPVVDKSALISAIAAAQVKHDAAVEGTAVGQYAVGSKATLASAITTATTASTSATTAGEVTTALNALNSAVATFDAAIVEQGTEIPTVNDEVTVSVINGVLLVNVAVNSIKVASISGNIVASTANVSNLANGIYVAIISLENGTVVSKTFKK